MKPEYLVESQEKGACIPTSYKARFGDNSELLHAYADDNLPRIAEIRHLHDALNFQKPTRVLNVPFEGNLVRLLASENMETTYADFVVPETLKEWGMVKTNYALDGLPRGYFDVVLSIAGIHHLEDEDQLIFLIGTRKVLNSNGQLLMVEVKDGSPTSRFLDEFVGEYTATGHKGNYLKENFVAMASRAGYKTVKRKTVVHPWVFKDEDHAFSWMSKFFGLSSVSKKELLCHVEEMLGMTQKTEALTVNWELDSILAKP
jgi:hypothetical protein